jgi:tetraacyldisaccharide 4'-kinase
MKPLQAVRRSLLRLVPAYRLALAFREFRLRNGLESVRRLGHPVISIGNLSTGGTGKTPFTIALAQALTRRGLMVDVLSRGYGRQSRLPARVHPDGTAADFGDEPLLIARDTGVPVYVAAQRYDAGLLAEKGSTSSQLIHLLDDGFQHRQLHRDIDILLLNSQDWHDTLLPAGNLREPIQSARRATILAIPFEEPNLKTELRAWGWPGPIWRLHRRMEVPPITGPIAAFCGIARPDQFFAGLAAAGLHVATRTAFPDHHRYIPHDIDCLIAAARTVKATALITTEKDLARLANLTSSFPESLPLTTAQLRIEIDDEAAAIEVLLSRLGSVSPQPSL